MKLTKATLKTNTVRIDNKLVTLIAPVQYQNLTEEELRDIVGGCGPGRFGDILIPDHILGTPIVEACKIHDYMQSVSEDFEDKKLSDKVFHTNLILIINECSSWKFAKYIKFFIAHLYYTSVKYAGIPFFVKAHLSHS